MERHLNNINYLNYVLLFLVFWFNGAIAIALLPLLYLMLKQPKNSNLAFVFLLSSIVLLGYDIGKEIALYESRYSVQ